MDMQAALVGNSIPNGNGIKLQHKRRELVQAAEEKSAILEQFTTFLPGNQETPEDEALSLHSIRNDSVQINQNFNKRLKFIVDHQSHEVTVKVIDGETDKVIKVLPPEELQRLNRRRGETVGFLFDEDV
ncbi:MAG: flagellar protein FlaG [Treponema sp.]|jgi:flagellar protein FlaG|nr:flagellar protein FlaG [Treponema sp.]